MIVHKTVTIARPPDVAFKIFVEEWDKWWPAEKYSFLGPEVTTEIEPRTGGRFVTKAPDGREYQIGDVLAYEPGARLSFTWNHENNSGSTEVDITFTAEGNGTRIDLTHSGFEKLAAAEEKFAGYGAGWEEILGLFERYATAA